MAELDLSLDPRQVLERRTLTAEAAAARVRSGEQIWIPSNHTTPAVLAALAKRGPELSGVKIRTVGLYDLGWFNRESMAHFDLQVQYAILPGARQALGEKLIDFHPFSMLMQHKAIDAGRDEAQPIDHLFITVSPPNENGWVCAGHSVWDSVSSAKRARSVTAEMSRGQVRMRGDCWLHVSQLDAIVLNDRPRLFAPDPTEFEPEDVEIAKHVKTLVRDGDTLQIGLGSHTGVLALLGAFDGRNDLGYFGELTVPGLVALAKRGIINGKRAALHPGKFVASHIGNSEADLDFVEDNPAFEVHSYEHTNEPRNVAAHEQMVAMNGALMVDLTGQIGVYAFGPRVYTGLGGHLGFAIGAFLAKRGRYVTVLPSTARGGAASTIVPLFERGQIVSIPRELADTVVTDHGVATLMGKSVRERTEALIAIAHPKFRDELRAEARKLYWP